MKRTCLFFSLIATLILLFTSCDNQIARGLMSASSAANEVMVVMDRAGWEGTAGDAVFAVLNSPAQGLPQSDPNFRTLHLTPDNFNRSFLRVRNVVIPNISDIFVEPRIRAESNVHAVGQWIMHINAPDTASFVQFVTEHKRDIVEFFLDKELQRNAQWLINNPRLDNWTIAREMFGVEVVQPRGLSHVVQEENFVWATNNAPRARVDFVMYQFPYTSPDVFTAESLIEIRNRVLGEHIRGQFDSQMRTYNTPRYPPHFRTFAVNGEFRAELRGLWEMTTDFMGGPFVMHAFVNENTGMVVVAEVFTFSPETSTNTRNLIRSAEASLYTINAL